MRGVWIAVSLIGAWGLHLTLLLVGAAPLWAWPLAVLLQAGLSTGLFITAHDAMHGTVAPAHPRLNRWIGRLSTLLYACFSFDALQRAHIDHHRYPATFDDPDYHRGDARFWPWYLGFLRRYVTVGQLLGMALAFNVLHHGAGVPLPRLLALWVLPSILSTIQLFYFGTYRPHRPAPEGYVEPHRARSDPWPPWVTLVTCYHFGRHWEHHASPGTPWWRLPSLPPR